MRTTHQDSLCLHIFPALRFNQGYFASWAVKLTLLADAYQTQLERWLLYQAKHSRNAAIYRSGVAPNTAASNPNDCAKDCPKVR